jgi:hypothetical protein
MRRRWTALLLAALTGATGILAVSAPPVVLAETSGWAGIVLGAPCVPIDPDPDSPEVLEVSVRGHGFEPGSTVDIYLSVEGSESFPDPSTTVRADDVGVFEGRIDVPLPSDRLTYVVYAATQGDGPSADARVSSPCLPTLSVTPTCTAPDAPFDITFVADGFAPGGGVYVGIIVPEGEEQIVSEPITADSAGRVEHTLRRIRPLPAGEYQAAAVASGEGAVIARSANTRLAIAQAAIELPCPSPSISLTPDCGPVGVPHQERYDVTVTGEGFAYGPAVITWDVGGSDEEFRIEEINDNGTFAIRIDPWQRPRGRLRVRVTQAFPFLTAGGDIPYVMGRYPVESRPSRVAQATFRVPCRPTATPTMDLDPDCDSPALVGDPERRYRIEVAATGLTPGPVDVVFDAGADAADVTPPEYFPAEVDTDGRLGPLTITPLARPEGEYRVTVLQRESPVIERVFRVPCDKPDRVVRPLQPACGPIAPGVEGTYSIRVRGRNFYPGTIELTFDSQGSPETRLATVGEDGMFDAVLIAIGRDRGEYTVLARQRDARGTVLRGTRVFTVPCVEPTLTVEPLSGPAGYATLVTGTDFPPGSTVTLSWDRGITSGTPIEATADTNGAFTMSVFILPHDFPGPRILGAGTPADPAAYPDVTAQYLVTGGTGQPADRGTIIERR